MSCVSHGSVKQKDSRQSRPGCRGEPITSGTNVWAAGASWSCGSSCCPAFPAGNLCGGQPADWPQGPNAGLASIQFPGQSPPPSPTGQLLPCLPSKIMTLGMGTSLLPQHGKTPSVMGSFCICGWAFGLGRCANLCLREDQLAHIRKDRCQGYHTLCFRERRLRNFMCLVVSRLGQPPRSRPLRRLVPLMKKPGAHSHVCHARSPLHPTGLSVLDYQGGKGS